MIIPRTNNAGNRNKSTGMTLIEILVVVGIIAILAAVLYPIFASVAENGHRATTISKLHEIGTQFARYRQDHGNKAPDVLFGYAYKKIGAADYSRMSDAVSDAQFDKAHPLPGDTPAIAAKRQNAYRYFATALYPTYIRTYETFLTPNNSEKDQTKVVSPAVNVLCTNGDNPNTLDSACAGQNPGALVPASSDPIEHSFYVMDSFDISPQVTGPDKLDMTVYVPRYQSSWTEINDALKGVNVLSVGSGRDDYSRQLRNPTSDTSTYVTCSTYHVPRDFVIVLSASGNVKSIRVKQFLDYGADVPSIAAVSGKSPAEFWKMAP